MIIYFEHWEIVRCAQVGLERWLNAERDGRRNAIVNDPLKWGIDHHVCGSIGEYTIAKMRGVDWVPKTDGPDTYVGDVGKFQVKSTTEEDNRLIIRANHPSEFAYVLVIVRRVERQPYRARIAGWIYGGDAKRSEFERSEKGIVSYFVPQKFLNPAQTLCSQRSTSTAAAGQ